MQISGRGKLSYRSKMILSLQKSNQQEDVFPSMSTRGTQTHSNSCKDINLGGHLEDDSTQSSSPNKSQFLVDTDNNELLRTPLFISADGDEPKPVLIETSYAFKTAELLFTNRILRKRHQPAGKPAKRFQNEQEILIQAYNCCYGWGCEKNLAKAFDLFHKGRTGKTSETEASYNIAVMTLNGMGTERNRYRGLSMLREVAAHPLVNFHDTYNKERNVGVVEARENLKWITEDRSTDASIPKDEFILPDAEEDAEYTFFHNCDAYETAIRLSIDCLERAGQIYVKPRHDRRCKTGGRLLDLPTLEKVCKMYAGEKSRFAEDLLNMVSQYCKILELVETCSDASTFASDFASAEEFVQVISNIFELSSLEILWDSQHLSQISGILEACLARKEEHPTQFWKDTLVALSEIYAVQERGEMGFKFMCDAWTFYPDQVQVSASLADYYSEVRDFNRAYMVGSEVLERFPNDYNLLFQHAQVCLNNMDETVCPRYEMEEKAINYFMRFLSLAPRSHPKVPEAYYTLGMIHFAAYEKNGARFYANAVEDGRYFLTMGALAEAKQLQCFLPYQSYMKDSLQASLCKEREDLPLNNNYNMEFYSKFCSNSPLLTSLDQSIQESVVLEQDGSTASHRAKSSLLAMNLVQDNLRIRAIQEFRAEIKRQLSKQKNSLGPYDEIYLGQEMNSRTDCYGRFYSPLSLRQAFAGGCKLWKNGIISVRIIDENMSGCGMPDSHILAEDADRDFVVVVLKRCGRFSLAEKSFGFGNKFNILSPQCLIVNNQRQIVVDNLNHIICVRKLEEELCRTCLRPGATLHCVRCKWAYYCNKDCQTFDWKVLKHKYICMENPPWNRTIVA